MAQNWLKPDWEPGLSTPNLPFEHLLSMGIKAILLDVDGTLLPSNELVLHSSVIDWICKAKNYFSIHLLSNNPSKRRIKSISSQIDVSYTYKAAKPTRGALIKALRTLNKDPKEIAIIGDRLFTDVIAGNRLGIYTVLVKPIGPNGMTSLTNKTQYIEQRIANIIGVLRK